MTVTSRHLCRICHWPLDPAVVAEGHDTHPTCDPYAKPKPTTTRQPTMEAAA